jgi:hypothetical protein
MKNMVIRSTAGDGAWLDGRGGLAKGTLRPAGAYARRRGMLA